MKLNKWPQSIILFIAFLLIFLHLSRHPEAFTYIKNLTLLNFILLLILRLLFLIINGLILKIYAEKFKIHLNHWEWVGLSFTTSLGNYIAPFSGGILYRAGYLKLKHNLSLTRFTILLASNYLLTFWCVALMGLVSSISLMVNSSCIPSQVPIFFGMVVIILIMMNLLPKPELSSQRWITKKIFEAYEGLIMLTQDKKLLIKIIFLIVLNNLIIGLAFFVGYQSIGIEILFPQALIISLITVFSLLINITPANLGIQEGVVSFASSTLNIGVSEGLIVALIVRGITMILIFTIGPYFLFLFSNKNS